MTLELSITLFPTSGEKKPFWLPGRGEIACSRRGRVLRKRPFDEVAVLGDSVDVGVTDGERGCRAGIHAEEGSGGGAEGVLRCKFAVDLPLLLGDTLAETVSDDIAVNVCSVEADFVYSDVSTERNRGGCYLCQALPASSRKLSKYCCASLSRFSAAVSPSNSSS